MVRLAASLGNAAKNLSRLSQSEKQSTIQQVRTRALKKVGEMCQRCDDVQKKEGAGSLPLFLALTRGSAGLPGASIFGQRSHLR